MAGGLLVAKGILGGIGGALEGAKGDVNMGKAPEAKDYSKEYSDIGSKIGEAIKENKTEAKSTEKTAKPTEETAKSATEQLQGASDYDLKQIYGEDVDDRIIENFAKISAIDFSYKPKAQEEYKGDYGVDNQEHIGVIAQELQQNEATSGAVNENENGDLVVDTRHLTFADTAAIAELARRVLALETVVKGLQNK